MRTASQASLTATLALNDPHRRLCQTTPEDDRSTPLKEKAMMYQFEVIAGHLTIVNTSRWDFMFGFRTIIKKLET